jgi:predicted phosphodiesterase
MKYALISDIHGNMPALESVLDSIKSNDIGIIYNLGDSIYGPLWPNQTADLLRNSDIKTILGNGDFDVLTNAKNNTMEMNYRELSEVNRKWITNLPQKIVENDITVFHGTPSSMYEYFFEYVDNEIIKIYELEEMVKKIDSIKTKYIGCGHSHIERIMTINNKILLNPGSVGLSAYSDYKPKHKIETWNNRARYIEIDDEEISIRYIEYDFRAAAKRARENNREDWAFSLETGRAKYY